MFQHSHRVLKHSHLPHLDQPTPSPHLTGQLCTYPRNSCRWTISASELPHLEPPISSFLWYFLPHWRFSLGFTLTFTNFNDCHWKQQGLNHRFSLLHIGSKSDCPFPPVLTSVALEYHGIPLSPYMVPSLQFSMHLQNRLAFFTHLPVIPLYWLSVFRLLTPD